MQPQPFDLLVASLVTWRVAYCLLEENGPWRISQRLRTLVGIDHAPDGTPVSYPDTTVGEIFSCMYCMSVWVAPMALLLSIFVWPLAWGLAASAGAILIHNLITGE